jgi:tetratricopeptide (TPR) repeat protein
MSGMSDMGDDMHDLVHAFADGELEPTEAEAFREHLAACEQCQAELNDILQLQALSGRLAATQEAPPSNVLRPMWGRRRTALTVVLGGAVAAAFALAVLRVPSGSTNGVGPEALALAPTRSLEARLSYGGASGWRPYNVKRSGNERPRELVPLETLAKLEKAGDHHGVATSYLLRGEREQAADSLSRISSTSPDVDSDRAVVALSKGELAEALRLLEGVLEKAPNHAPALWNRGLVLRELGLDLLAAQSFAKVAALNEQGWSDEARERQAALERQTLEQRTPAYPEPSQVPEPLNLDTWDFAGTPLFAGASSIYLVGFESPTDATRAYVYGVDVQGGKFVFVGTIAKRLVSGLTQRTGLDIDALKSAGTPKPRSGLALQLEGPATPPPGTQELTVQSLAKRGWRLAVELDQLAAKLSP